MDAVAQPPHRRIDVIIEPSESPAKHTHGRDHFLSGGRQVEPSLIKVLKPGTIQTAEVLFQDAIVIVDGGQRHGRGLIQTSLRLPASRPFAAKFHDEGQLDGGGQSQGEQPAAVLILFHGEGDGGGQHQLQLRPATHGLGGLEPLVVLDLAFWGGQVGQRPR